MLSFVNKIGDLMGLSEGQARFFLAIFAFAAVLGLWFAIDSALLFYRGFQSGGVIEPSARESEIIDDFNSDTVMVEVDKIVPPGYYTDTGQLVLCGSHMVGDTALRYGWVWDEDDEGGGVCRRLVER